MNEQQTSETSLGFKVCPVHGSSVGQPGCVYCGPRTLETNTTSAADKVAGVKEAERFTPPYTADNGDSKSVAAAGHSSAPGALSSNLVVQLRACLEWRDGPLAPERRVQVIAGRSEAFWQTLRILFTADETEAPDLAAAERLAAIALKGAGIHAERVVHQSRTIKSLCDRLDRIHKITCDAKRDSEERLTEIAQWSGGFMPAPAEKSTQRLGHDEAQAEIATHVRQIEKLCDAFGYDQTQWLAEKTNEVPAVHDERSDIRSMRLDTPAGARIVFMDRNGYPGELDWCRKSGLLKGREYTVAEIDVHESISYVYLREFGRKRFNTVHFVNAENGEAGQ